MTKVILGIDVSKKELSLALLINETFKKKRISNDEQGFEELLNWLKQLNISKVEACMEATGHYGTKVANFLFQHNHEVSIVNPACIKAFSRSRLKRHKTDEVDSMLIAEYASKNTLKNYKPQEPHLIELRVLYRCTQNLKKQHTQISHLLEGKDYLPESVFSCYKRLVKQLEKEIAKIESVIEILLTANPELKIDSENLQTIPGIGKTTAVAILAEVPNLSSFCTARQLAAYAGLTPSHRTSGSSIKGKARLSKMGSSTLRKALYFAAIVAKNHNPLFKSFSSKMKSKGKHNMVIIGAIMRKLLHIIYGILKSKSTFDITIYNIA